MRVIAHARRTFLTIAAVAMLFGCGSQGVLLIKNENRNPVTVWIYQPDTRPGARSDSFVWASAGSIPPDGQKEFSKEIANLGPQGKLRIQPGGGPVQGVAIDPGGFSGSGCGGERKSTVTMKSNETLEFGPGTKATTP